MQDRRLKNVILSRLTAAMPPQNPVGYGVMSIAIEFFPKARYMFTQDTLYTLMNEFGDKESIFHDEDDFQLQLFKRMEERYGNVCTVEREYPTLISGERAKIDIILQTPEEILPKDGNPKKLSRH